MLIHRSCRGADVLFSFVLFSANLHTKQQGRLYRSIEELELVARPAQIALHPLNNQSNNSDNTMSNEIPKTMKAFVIAETVSLGAALHANDPSHYCSQGVTACATW